MLTVAERRQCTDIWNSVARDDPLLRYDMNKLILPGLIFIILVTFCSTVDCAIRQSYYNFYENELDEIPEGSATLAFVFDITGSMYDDLVQVIRGAARILSTLLERREKPIYNYVLVPFHDPDIGPVTVTTDPDIFHQQLKDLYVQGGGDCPEMTVGAVKLALEVSLPNSYIYVFTDARAKDYNLLESVLKLMQKKESQVIFVMTGDCGDQTHPGYQAYERIALSSSGQVFHLKKSDVDEVLNFVQVSLQSRKVNLLAIDKNEGDSTEVVVHVDSNLREFTLSLSGDNPVLTLINPKGEVVDVDNGLNDLLNLNNVRIVNVKDPIPGQWLFKMKSDSRHSIRSTGLSGLDFQHGYSRQPTSNLAETYHRPLRSAKTYLLVNATELFEPGRFTKIQLIDLEGNILLEVPLERMHDAKSLFTTAFIPPNQYFYLKVLGFDDKGHPFQRMTAVPISSQMPGIPEVTTRPHLFGYYDKEVTLRCYVESLVPFTAVWYKDNIQISQEHQFPQTTELTMTIPEVRSFSEGYYTCNATNIAGSASSTTFLDVKEPPPIILKPENVSAIPGNTAILSCSISSTVDYNTTWFKLFIDKAGYFRQKRIMDSSRMTFHKNDSLAIHQVVHDDEGWYRCVAANEGGFKRERLYLTVQAPPVVSIFPPNPKFTSDDTVNMTCIVTGYPAPSVQWIWDRKHDKAMQEGRIYLEDNSLFVSRAHPDDEGHYECLGKNSAGTNSKSVFLQYIEAPVITLPERQILVRHGDVAVLRCIAEGIPLPYVNWYHNNIHILPSSYIHLDSSGTLSINGVQDTDSGNYTCLATNEAGYISETLHLDVGSVPAIVDSPVDTFIDIGGNGSIPCSATGLPSPTITWQRKNGENLKTDERFTVTTSGTLFIREITKEDEGVYECIVENRFGRHMLDAYVTVTGIVAPVLEDVDPVAAVEKGRTIFLPCTVSQGNPKPFIQWFWNGRIITNDYDMQILEDGTLKIENANNYHQASYTCIASNIGGNISQTINLDIQEPPTFIGDIKDTHVVVEGQDISLSCAVEGNPKPDITWFKDNKALIVDNNQIKIYHSSELYISNIGEEDAGIYTCQAVNIIGTKNQSTNIIVHVPPKLKDVQQIYTVLNGDVVTLPCEAYSIPKANIYWYHNNSHIPEDATILSNGHLHFKATTNHSGDYLCQARNIAGSSAKRFSVTVWIIPEIRTDSESPENIIIVENEPLKIRCPVMGYPHPSVYWEKDTTPIQPSENVDLQDGTVLVLMSAHVSDSGQYRCIASNNAGTADKNFTVTVHVPPVIKSENPFITAVEASDISLDCEVTGLPQPIVTWNKQKETFYDHKFHPSVAANNSLILLDVSVNDSGIYNCIAKNPAGNDSITVHLNIIVPPKIDKSQVLTKVQVIEEQSVTLLCPVFGIPSPHITWYYNNSDIAIISNATMSVLKNGQILTINKIQESQAGTYTCEAVNDAGVEEINILLEILVPPKFTDPHHISNLYILQGDTLFINCTLTGNPQPKISWRKDGYPLTAVNPFNVYIEDEILIIKSSQISDSGRYSCMAENVAGHISREYQVSVVVPPWLEEDNYEKLEVILSHSAILNCPVNGIPPPSITWMKDNDILRKSGARLSNGGQTLILSHTELEDEGIYNCIAENRAGDIMKTIELFILVPPSIKDQQITEIIRPMKNDTVVLGCEVSGKPHPEVRWMKNDLSITLLYRYPDFEIKETKLVIANVTESDGGRYICTAVNTAGSSQKDFSVNVMVPPKLMEEAEELKTRHEIILGNPIQLFCPVFGQPVPRITWLKSGIPINNPDVILLEKGRILHIYHSSNENNGHYTCLAENEAGKTEKHYDINVVVPPYIGEVVSRHNVKVGDKVYLYCPVIGSPAPDIVWLHNGQLIQSLNRSDIQITENGTLIQIESIESRHGGQYTCIASNLAGTADKNFHMDVSVPPSIIQTENATSELSALLNHPVTVTCPVRGTPTPSIKWLKNGKPVEHFGDTNVMISADRRHLIIRHARLSDTSVYKCIAINRAGKTEKETTLKVLVPPRLLHHTTRGDQAPYDEEEHIQVLENKTLILQCEVDAVPTPTVLWFKDGNLLKPNEEYEILDAAQILRISSSQSQNAGRYTCIISNVVGTIEKDFMVDILVPPKLTGSSNEVLEAQLHRPLTVRCNVNGKPDPSVTWFMNGQPIEKSDSRFLLSHNNKEIQFHHISSKDSHSLKCVAENEVGKTEQIFNLDIHEPPVVKRNESELDIMEEKSSRLVCEVTGNPQPSIKWLKNDIILTDNDFTKMGLKLYNNGQILYIHNTTADHQGKYTCIVSNYIGTTEKSIMLNVLVPPKLVNTTVSKYVRIGDSVSFSCPVVSNPRAHITWMKDGRPIDFSNPFIHVLDNGETLRLLRSREIDSGHFSCIARNRVGEVRGLFPLHVLVPPSIDQSNIMTSKNGVINGTVILECPAVGFPSPSINWWLNNELISFSNNSRYSILSDGKKLRISPIDKADAGKLKCIAKNRIGNDEVEYTLDVFVPPTINKTKNNSILQALEGKTVTIACPLESANPVPAIMWLKDGHPVSSSVHPSLFLTSPDGLFLTLRRLHVTNSGTYKCTASNVAGQAEYNTTLEVIVPPMILDVPGKQRNPKIIQDQSLTLTCKSDGIPKPKVFWKKNGTLLNSEDYKMIHAGEVLRILETKSDDAGQYTCIAENAAGSANKTFDVSILVPPYMNPSSSQSKMSALIHNDIHLRCPAVGVPLPWITWYKNSRLLINGPHYQMSSNQTNLLIKDTTFQDEGSYVCTAVNEAGSAKKEILLTIFVPPKITRVGLISNQPAVLQQSVRLVCETEGFPAPFVSWFRNEQLLTTNNIKVYYIQNQGHILELESLHSSDGGTYTCFAENSVGLTERNYTLTILEPPLIANRSKTIDVTLGTSVDIECLVFGDPLPQVSWLKEGQPVENIADIVLRINNTLLSINSTVEDHDGKYTCVATNQVGSMEQDFYLNVQIKPYFDNGDEEVYVAVNRPLKLNCHPKGKPSPDILWFKNDQLILPTDNIYINDHYLQIHRTSQYHQGNYSCKARNTAGHSNKNFVVTVTVPPYITNNDQTVYLSTVTNNSVEMSCSFKGAPNPAIMWKKDGHLIDSANTKIYEHSSVLKIEYPNLDDIGIYTCIATNIVGNSSKNFVLSVLETPRITDKTKENMKGVLGQTMVIACDVAGYPLPDVSWMKNGASLQNGEIHHISDEGSLHFYSLKEIDAANYTCIATNEAGSVNKTISLDVLVPPAIEDGRADVHVLIDEPTILECQVSGFPEPHVVWLKGTKVLQEETEYIKLEKGSLYLSKSYPNHTGQYMCIAENEAGSAKTIRNLWIESPAIVKDEFLREVTVIEGEDLELFCPTKGYPPPKVIWEKDTETISSSQPRYHSNTLGDLRIAMTQLEDGGNYRCIAENNAGKDSKVVNVIVHVPAVIQQDQAIPTIEALQGGSIVLPCEVSGFPPPEISWQHNGNVINVGSVSAQNPGDLQLNNLKEDDSGQYVCFAVNEAGQDYSEVNVQVLVPPTITILPDNQNISVGSQFSLKCEAKGYPVPTVTWFRNNQKLSGGEHQSSEGSKHYTKLHAEVDDDGNYTCVVQNSVGEKKVEVSVRVRVDGSWSSWNEWSPCSRSCGTGTRTRTRECDSPLPTNGGRYCLGLNQQIDYCNNNHCPIHGGWSAWSSWGECSASCSGGQQKSFRTCTNPSPNHDGRPCAGPSYKSKLCNTQSCSDSPNRVIGKLIGEINNVDISLSKIETNITSGESQTKIMMKVHNIPDNIGQWIKILVPLVPLHWVRAFEIGQALNGYSLTKGFFHSDADVTFPTGESVHMTHVARGIDKDGHLLIDVVVSGNTPEIHKDAIVTFSPYVEDYIQIGPGLLYAKSSRTFLINNYKLPYAWNYTISYDKSYGEMPFPIEKLQVTDIYSNYDHHTEELNYSLSSTISLDSQSSQCPEGFKIYPTGLYCTDINECEESNRCQHFCENILGGYYCVCPLGYALSSNQHTCTDIDECLVLNISCGSERTCFNTRGSFRCVDTPCPPHYHRDPVTRYCKLECSYNDPDCTQHMKYSEILAFKMVALPKGVEAYEDLIRLTAFDQEGNHLPHSTFTITDNNTGVPFRIRLDSGRGVLYTLRDLEPKEYRIKVQAISYDDTYQNIQHTTKFLVFVSISEYPY